MRASRVARVVLVPYVISRIVVVGTLATTRHIVTPRHFPVPVETHTGLLAWDAAWYRDIAHLGYDRVASEGLRFFPLFPLLGRAVSWFPGASTGFGVVFVANASALALGFALHRLVLRERHDPGLARRAVWVVYVSPPAFVLVMGYAEATFMTFAAIFLLGLRSRRWWTAAILGFLAGLTRPVGVLLAVPAVVEGYQQRDLKAAAPAAAPGGRRCPPRPRRWSACSPTSYGPHIARTISGTRCGPSRIRRGAGTGSIPCARSHTTCTSSSSATM